MTRISTREPQIPEPETGPTQALDGSTSERPKGLAQEPAADGLADGVETAISGSPLFARPTNDDDLSLNTPELSLDEDIRDLLAMTAARQAQGFVTPPLASGGTPSPADVRANIESIEVQASKEKTVVHDPWAMNQLAPANKGDKKSAYNEFRRVESILVKASDAETAAHASLARASKAHEQAPSPATTRTLAAAESRLTMAQETRMTAEADLARQESVLKAKLKAISPHNSEAIDSLQLRGHEVDGDLFTVGVGTAKVELSNNVDAYAATNQAGFVGKAVGDDQKVVLAAIERTSFSDSTKRLLKATSENEGNFSSINSWDRKLLTFGFIQMAGGGKGEVLSNMLAAYKKNHADAFAHDLQKYGIDVETSRQGGELVLHTSEGQVLRGDAAARKIGTDPCLAGALAASGVNPEMQANQLQFAKGYLDRARGGDLVVGDQKIKVSDLLTSELGNGVLFDRSVHEGIGGARAVLTGVVAKHLEENPKASLNDESVRAAIEGEYIAQIAKNKDLAGRTATIAKNTSRVRGSFVD